MATTVGNHGILRRLLHRDRMTGQLARFAVVGVLNSIVDLGAFYLFMHIPGVPAPGEEGFTYYSTAAKGVSYVLGICNSFFWNKYWTFSAGGSARASASSASSSWSTCRRWRSTSSCSGCWAYG